MLNKLILSLMLFFVSFKACYAENFDRDAMIIYSPIININPDDNASLYPESLPVKLLLSKKGDVVEVYYPKGTNSQVIKKTEPFIKSSRFSPYIQKGVPVASIVPYTMTFYFLSEEEYRGH